ncbi:MAG: hypothetical protein DMF56_21065 [Acidobacteria bacterium]|nr:MAG: hypothetical protein DMF56_21065 [Acidobacteriota bacterium]
MTSPVCAFTRAVPSTSVSGCGFAGWTAIARTGIALKNHDTTRTLPSRSTVARNDFPRPSPTSARTFDGNSIDDSLIFRPFSTSSTARRKCESGCSSSI